MSWNWKFVKNNKTHKSFFIQYSSDVIPAILGFFLVWVLGKETRFTITALDRLHEFGIRIGKHEWNLLLTIYLMVQFTSVCYSNNDFSGSIQIPCIVLMWTSSKHWNVLTYIIGLLLNLEFVSSNAFILYEFWRDIINKKSVLCRQKQFVDSTLLLKAQRY